MDSAVNIIEIIDGKYRLNIESLRSVISQAQDCHKIALISVIGSKYIGKSLLFNYMIDYLDSKDKSNWPKSHIIKYGVGFKNDIRYSNPVIFLWSKPFIMEDDNQRTAIFLMDSMNVFTQLSEISMTKMTEEIIGLFMLTSSTFIYFRSSILRLEEIERFQNCVKKSLDRLESVDSFQELFFYIRDWDSMIAEKDHRFGLKGGKNYWTDEFSNLELDRYWHNIECYLMPLPGYSINEADVNFSKLNDQYIVELSHLIKLKLLNFDEMQIKINPKTGEPINSSDLIELFESYMYKLDAEAYAQNLVNTDNTSSYISPCNPTRSTVIIYFRETTIIEKKLDESYSNLTQAMDSGLKLGEEVLRTAETFNSNKVFGDNRAQHQKVFTYPFGVDTNDAQVIQVHSDETEKMEVDLNVEDPQMKSEFNDGNEGQKDIEKTYEITNAADYEMRDLEERVKNLSLNTPSENQIETQEISTHELHEYYQQLLMNYTTKIENILKDENFDFENGLSKAHNDMERETMSLFDDHFEHDEHNQLIREYRERLYTEINLARDKFNTEFDEQLKKIKKQYIFVMNKSINFYGQRMRSDIEYQFNKDTEFSLTKVHAQNRQTSVESFESTANKIKKIPKLVKEFSSKLKLELNERKKIFENALNLIKSYRTEWAENFREYRYISLTRMREIHESLSNKTSHLLNKSEDQDLKRIILNQLDNIFVSIMNKNEAIDNDEIKIAEDITNFVFGLYCKRFDNKLRSGLYSSISFDEMHQKLLDYTLKTMKDDCEFRKYQTHLSDKCEKDLKVKVNQNYNKITSDYFKLTADTKSILNKAKDEALKKYRTEMKISLSSKPYYKRSELESISSQYCGEALKVNEELIQCLKYHYNLDFYKFLLSENIKEIERNIDIEKDRLKKENDKNAPKVSSITIYFGRYDLIAANCEREIIYILDKNGSKLRSNSIAFSDEVLFGNEAKIFNESRESDKEDSINKNFDIKQLIAKARRDISIDELNSYPFVFVNDKLRVKFENDFMKHNYSIESLIALQVMDIKLDAEKQLGNTVSSAVFTVPTYYNLKQRDAFKDVARIAGLEEVYILSEISAAAISYAIDANRIKKDSLSSVFFIIINDFECDAAVCQFKDMNIEYKSYCHQNLSSYIKKTSIVTDIKEGVLNLFKRAKEKSQYDYFLKSIENLFDRTLQTAIIEPKKIDKIAIGGSSILMRLLKEFTADYFSSNSFFLCDAIDIIINGSAIFNQMMANNKSSALCIKELSSHNYFYTIEGEYIPKQKLQPLIKNNKLLPLSKVISLHPPQEYNLPLILSIFQEQTLVSQFRITYLPKSRNFKPWYNHKIKFTLNKFGEISLLSKLLTQDMNISEDLKLLEFKLGLSEEDIIEEQKMIASIEQEIKDNLKLSEKNSEIKQARNDLEICYFEVKKSIDSANSTLRGLKKKKITAELENTLNIIQTSNDLKTITNQKLQLKQTVECLLK